MSCLMCDGDGITALGEPCPLCSGKRNDFCFSVNPWIPIQYQGNRYSASALPLVMHEWALEMEQLREDIVQRIDQKNYLICSPYRTGKTVWAYDLLECLAKAGQRVEPIADLMDIRRIMYSYKEDDINTMVKLMAVPVLVVRIPPLVNSSSIQTMQALLYKRVANNGQTIFLFPGNYYAMAEECGNKEMLSTLIGDGSLGSIKLKNYRRNKDGEPKD